jgi:signal transduction histidine kinase
VNILIVEDSKTQVERLQFLLEENNYIVLAAKNGDEALKKIDLFKPDIIISDIVMPKLNGYDLCKSVRMHPTFKDIIFILVSTLTEVEDIILGLESGANYIISKPYEDDQLILQLNQAIKINTLRKNNKSDDKVTIVVNRKEHVINSKKYQILDFLVSTYEMAVLKNKELYETRIKLEELNNILEERVNQRTAELRIEMEEHKRYEKQFLEAQKLESIGKLTGGIAHDFNNLLLVALGNLELLSGSFKIESEEIKNLQHAVMALERGSAVTKHLLSFARKQDLFPKSINIKVLLDNTIGLLKSALGERVSISCTCDEAPWFVWIDPFQFENVIMNMSINARDAMSKNGKLHFNISNITITNTTEFLKEKMNIGDYVKLSIIDNGCGMSQETMNHIFEPFYTTKKVGDGTGLGLSMVYGFIKQSNGNITVESKVGTGTTFNIYLPKSEKLVEQNPDKLVEKVATLRGNEVILIAEDEIAILKLVSTYLSKLGYQIITATNGLEALTILKSGKSIDLLFSDVIMPGNLTGPELALEAKKINPNLKILLTSGYTKDTFINEKFDTDCVVHLPKPYKLDALATQLRIIFDKE